MGHSLCCATRDEGALEGRNAATGCAGRLATPHPGLPHSWEVLVSLRKAPGLSFIQQLLSEPLSLGRSVFQKFDLPVLGGEL